VRLRYASVLQDASWLPAPHFLIISRRQAA